MKHAAVLVALAAAATLGVAACGGGGGTAPAHTAQPGEPALIAVPGYDYTDASGDVAAHASGAVKADPVHFRSASTHNVLREGTELGGIILLEVKPEFANDPEVQKSLLPAMAAEMSGSGAKVTLETVHGEKVAITQKGANDVYVWFHAGAVTMVIGNRGKGADIRDFVDAYLKTANASTVTAVR